MSASDFMLGFVSGVVAATAAIRVVAERILRHDRAEPASPLPDGMVSVKIQGSGPVLVPMSEDDIAAFARLIEIVKPDDSKGA